MRTCNNCQAGVPDASESCPRCGNLVPRGLLSSILGRFRAKPAAGQAGVPAPSTPHRREAAGTFTFRVEDVFGISGRGTVVTGRVASGEIHVGDEVRFPSTKGKWVQCRVNGIEMFRKVVEVGRAGDDVGLLLSKVKPEDIQVGAATELA